MPNLEMTPDADQKRQQLLSMALRVGSFGYFIQDISGGKVWWSPETFEIWGVPIEQGQPSIDEINASFHPDERDALAAAQADTAWGKRILDFRILRPSGEVRYIRAHIEREHDEHGRLKLAYGILLDNTERRRTELALQHSESRFKSLFETTGAGMVITDPHAQILFANAAFGKLLGYMPSELLGKSIRDLSPPDTAKTTLEMVQDMRGGGVSSRDIEKPYLHRDGHLVWARLTINLHHTSMGREEFIGVIQDLSERHEAENRLRDSERLLNVAQNIGKIGHWVWHIDSGVVEWSDEMCRIVGYPPGQNISRGHRMEKHVHPDDMKSFRAMIDQIRDGGSGQGHEFRLVRVDDTIRHVIGRAMPVNDGGTGQHMIGTIQDITEHKIREDALRRESVRAEAANRAKTLFLANMSHELRTPLNAILGFAQLLSMGTRGDLNAAQKDYVASIMRGGEHLLRLINDVLDLSRIDSGHLALTIAPVSLSTVVDEILDSFAQQAQTRRIALVSNRTEAKHLCVNADLMRVTQVLVNLVSNAIKFNRVGGSVTIEIAPIENERVRVAVSDTGHGIPKDRHAEVFQHFNRLGAESQGVDGTGIGLALSKRLVEEMNGTMGFASEPHVKTSFCLICPAQPPPPKRISPLSCAPHSRLVTTENELRLDKGVSRLSIPIEYFPLAPFRGRGLSYKIALHVIVII